MADKIYTIDEIEAVVAPIARAYGVERITLFGSYARGDATHGSDVDLRIDSGGQMGYFELAGLQRKLEEQFNLRVDILPTDALSMDFRNRIKEEEVILYGE